MLSYVNFFEKILYQFLADDRQERDVKLPKMTTKRTTTANKFRKIK